MTAGLEKETIGEWQTTAAVVVEEVTREELRQVNAPSVMPRRRCKAPVSFSSFVDLYSIHSRSHACMPPVVDL